MAPVPFSCLHSARPSCRLAVLPLPACITMIAMHEKDEWMEDGRIEHTFFFTFCTNNRIYTASPR